MTGQPAFVGARAAEFRAAFDRTFAEPIRIETARTTDLLAIRVAGDRYALALAQVAKLLGGPRVTPVPGPVAELVGIASDRSVIFPVYDLGRLLGREASEGAPYWIVVAAGPVAMGFAFDGFDGHVRVRNDAIVARPPGDAGRRFLREVVETPAAALPLIDIPSVIESIEATVRGAASGKER
ncbi:MAG TPA: chemotaxis protein CheW [Steroidobacteraceae bacterium]|jgi:purine-binding chemotaxis protein CheW